MQESNASGSQASMELDRKTAERHTEERLGEERPIQEKSSKEMLEAPDKQPSSLARTAIFTAVLCASFLFALDNTIVAVMQARIIERFGQIEKLPWISVSYQLGSTCANLLWGRLFQHFNHKYVFISGLVMFEVGSVVCGAAPSMNALIIGRVLCGIGGNGIYSGTMNIISDLTTIQQRPVYLSYFGALWGVGTVLGPIVGGALTSASSNGWRWCFYLNLFICAIFAPVYIFVLPSLPRAQGQSLLTRIMKIDHVGNIIFIGAWVSGVMALSFGGAEYAWSSASVIIPLCFSGVLFLSFAAQQRFSILVRPENRLFPVHLLASWENWIFIVQCAASHASQLIPVYYIPLYFQFVHSNSAIESGVRLLPSICFAVFFCLLNGALMVKLGYYMPWFFFGSIGVVVGAALMSTVSAGTAYSTIYGFSILLGAGNGAFTQASFPVAQAKHPPAEMANVVAILVCAQRFGITMGFSVANAVFINRASSLVARVLPDQPRASVQAAIAGGSAAIFSGLPADQKQAVSEAVAKAMDNVYYQVLAGGAACLVLSVFMKREKLFKKPEAEPLPKS